MDSEGKTALPPKLWNGLDAEHSGLQRKAKGIIEKSKAEQVIEAESAFIELLGIGKEVVAPLGKAFAWLFPGRHMVLGNKLSFFH